VSPDAIFPLFRWPRGRKGDRTPGRGARPPSLPRPFRAQAWWRRPGGLDVGRIPGDDSQEPPGSRARVARGAFLIPGGVNYCTDFAWKNGKDYVQATFTRREKEEPVYNLEVDADHCYRVGECGLLVHNSSATRELFAEQGFDFCDIEPANNSTTRQVYRVRGRGRAAPPNEVQVGDQIYTTYSRPIVLSPTGNQPGIDGVYRDVDRAVSLKNVTGAQPQNQPRQVVVRANQAYAQARAAGFTDVDVYILATGTTKADVTQRWNATAAQPALDPMPGGYIRQIVVFCSDGQIIFSSPAST
jgi:hypothetical protein